MCIIIIRNNSTEGGGGKCGFHLWKKEEKDFFLSMLLSYFLKM